MKPKLLALLLLLTPLAAKAQVGVYTLFTVTHLSNIASSPGTFPGTSYRDSTNPSGFTGGIYYDFRKVGPVRLGVDARGSLLHVSRGGETNAVGAGTRADSVLGGVRASFKLPITALAPYVQASAGLGRSNYGLNGPALHNAFEYHVFAGLDIKVLPVLDFRAFEAGYGGLNASGTGSHNYPLASISTGLVFHLPKLP